MSKVEMSSVAEDVQDKLDKRKLIWMAFSEPQVKICLAGVAVCTLVGLTTFLGKSQEWFLQDVHGSPILWCSCGAFISIACLWKYLAHYVALAILLSDATRRYASEGFDLRIWLVTFRIRQISNRLRGDPDYMRSAVCKYGWWMCEGLSVKLCEDQEFLLSLIQSNFKVLRSKKFTGFIGDADLMLQVAKDQPLALRFAARGLLKDQRFMSQSISKNGGALCVAPANMKADAQIVLEAIDSNATALAYASPRLRSDTSIVLHAVQCDWAALKWASRELRDDSEIVLAAIRSYGTRKSSRSIAGQTMQATVAEPGPLLFASSRLRADVDVVLESVRHCGDALQFAVAKLRNDSKVVLEAVKQDGLALRWASQDLRANPQIVFQAVQQNWQALQHARGAALMEMDVWEVAVQQDEQAAQYLPGMQDPHGGLCISG